MANKNIKNLYEQVFNQVFTKIEGTRRGLLYKTIQIIFREEQSQTQEKTLAICNELGIKPSADREEDDKIISDLIDRQALARFISSRETINKIPIRINQSVNDEAVKMKWIVIAACILVGVYFCIQYLKATKQQEETQKRGIEVTKPQPSPPIPAALCLIVPASIASNFKNGANLNVEQLTHLIDSASYFLCTHIKAANSIEELLETTDEQIPSDSKREVYIRINIDDGRNLIDKKIPYYLKTNLPTNLQCIVKQLACLKSLSGLEKFNRV